MQFPLRIPKSFHGAKKKQKKSQNQYHQHILTRHESEWKPTIIMIKKNKRK